MGVRSCVSVSVGRNTRGSHEIWINTASHARTTIPDWGNRDLRVGTIAGILRDLGISRQEFEQG